MKKISIILVNWNGSKWIDRCLSSLAQQTFKAFEIIVVDNNSSDDSIQKISDSDSPVKLVKNPKNLGFAAGNNVGVNLANGSYILLLNTDTWVEEDFLQKIVNFYNRNNYDVVAPFEADYYSKQKRTPYTSKIDPFGHPVYQDVKKNNANLSFFLTGACLFFSKDLYAQTNGLDDNFFMYSEEVDWFWRLNLTNKNFTYVNDTYVYHAGSGSTVKGINRNTFLWRNQNTLQMLLKNYQFTTLIFILPIYLLQNIVEIIFFALILKPEISYTYIQGWVFNIKSIKKIMNKRKKIQEIRTVNDMFILRRMYFGSGKFINLLKFLSFKKKYGD